MCLCVCVCVAKPVAVELCCHATALIAYAKSQFSHNAAQIPVILCFSPDTTCVCFSKVNSNVLLNLI